MKANDDKKNEQISRWDPRRGQGLQHMGTGELDWERLQKINPFARGIAQRQAKENQPELPAKRQGSWVYAYGMFFWDSRVSSPADVAAIYGNDGYYVEIGRTYTADTGQTLTMLADGMVQRHGEAAPYKAKDMAGKFDHLRSKPNNPNAKLPTPSNGGGDKKEGTTTGEKQHEPPAEIPKTPIPSKNIAPLKPLNLEDEIGAAFQEKVNGIKGTVDVEPAGEKENGEGELSEQEEEEIRWWLKIFKSASAMTPEEKNQLLQGFRDFADALGYMVHWIPILNRLPGLFHTVADTLESGIDFEKLEEEAISRLKAGKKASKSLGVKENGNKKNREKYKTWKERKEKNKDKEKKEKKKKLVYNYHFSDRHKRTKNQKDKNSLIAKSVDWKADVEEINMGQAFEFKNAAGVKSFRVKSGREYGVHGDSVHPTSGPGVYELDRPTYKAIGIIQKGKREGKNDTEILADLKINQMQPNIIKDALDIFSKLQQ